MDYRAALLNPRLARELPDPSLERALASLALRQIWHLIYDPCPTLLALHPPDGKALLDRFLEHCEQTSHSMDWTLHLALLKFLNPSGDSPLIREFLIAAATRWSFGDLSERSGVALWHPQLDKRAICAWKPQDASKLPRMVEVLLPDAPGHTGPLMAFFDRMTDAPPKRWTAITGERGP